MFVSIINLASVAKSAFDIKKANVEVKFESYMYNEMVKTIEYSEFVTGENHQVVYTLEDQDMKDYMKVLGIKVNLMVKEAARKGINLPLEWRKRNVKKVDKMEEVNEILARISARGEVK